MLISDKMTDISPSATLGITSKAKSMVQSGEDVIILAAGEPDFDTPGEIKEAAIKAIENGMTKYTPASGTKSLKEAICRKFKRDNGLDYTAKNIVVSNGAKHSIYNILQVLCNPGDEVIIIAPYWLSYPEMIKMAGGKPVTVKTRPEDGFKVTVRGLDGVIGKKTKALILNSPSNPAGVVYGRDELKDIMDLCVSRGIMVISDEIYEKIIFDGREHVSIASVSDEARGNTILVNGVSKSYAMTGWRIGYVAGPENIVERISTMQSHSTSNPCSISQAAAERALADDMEQGVAANNKEFQGRRDELIKYLDGAKGMRPVVPEGSFYLFCGIGDTGMDSFTFSERVLAEKKVAVIPGGPFGEDSFIRISFAAGYDQLKEGVGRIKDWLLSV